MYRTMKIRKELTRQKLDKPFPQEHIQLLGGGTVGPITLLRDGHGKIRQAEADLDRAPFKKMVIADPELLRMFTKDGEIDVSAVTPNGHPWPRFRLGQLYPEKDPDNWEVGYLSLIPNADTSMKTIKQPPTVKLVPKPRIAPPYRPPTPNPVGRVDPSPHLMVWDDDEADSMTLDQAKAIQDSLLENELLPLLSANDAERYMTIFNAFPVRSPKEGAKYKFQVIKAIRVIFNRYGDRDLVLGRLHNRIIRFQWKIVGKANRQIPTYDLPSV
ncbi:hypothetical protein P280DRAFT_523142 [Massarina eburnea CBS 473.64]|uniref:Uncharacterized protein n=1 Tax=Massarina eburnea CBS 473.64 TaxID=1395130 RepID=A0A6A6RMP0_9PLEO|nr:hypothetical protein P280DRAFT_523142 [Massarina eburnea CBS 473.64]